MHPAHTSIKIGVFLFMFGFAAPVFCADDFLGQAIKGFRYPAYDPKGQLKMEISGDQANVLPHGLIQISNLKMIFYEEGKKIMRVSTPLCFYNRTKQTAVSTTEVCITRAEIVITGRGFDWDEKEARISINNNVMVTIAKTGQKAQLEEDMRIAETSAPPNQAKAEYDTNCTVITSSRLNFDQEKSIAVFKGQVVVTDSALKIESDRLTVSFANDKKVEAIEAEGNVVITRNDIKASSQKAVYTVANGKVILFGKPGISRERDRLNAETIVFWRDSNRILCEPNAHLTVYSDQDMRSQFRKY